MIESISEFFYYVKDRFLNFVERANIRGLWSSFFEFCKKFQNDMSDEVFEIVVWAIIVITLLLVVFLFRFIYCKCYLEEYFKCEFTYLKDFFRFDFFEEGIDSGTLLFIIISIGYLIAIAFSFIAVLVLNRYLIVSFFLFIFTILIVFLATKSIVDTMGIAKGLFFSIIYILFLSVSNIMFIFSLICFYLLTIFWHVCIFMIICIPVIGDLFADSDIPMHYGETFCDYHGNRRTDYKYEGEDVLGNIKLKDKDGNEITARKDKDGNIRRTDNYKYLD